jgi:hypothetical protein
MGDHRPGRQRDPRHLRRRRQQIETVQNYSTTPAASSNIVTAYAFNAGTRCIFETCKRKQEQSRNKRLSSWVVSRRPVPAYSLILANFGR